MVIATGRDAVFGVRENDTDGDAEDGVPTERGVEWGHGGRRLYRERDKMGTPGTASLPSAASAQLLQPSS